MGTVIPCLLTILVTSAKKTQKNYPRGGFSGFPGAAVLCEFYAENVSQPTHESLAAQRFVAADAFLNSRQLVFAARLNDVFGKCPGITRVKWELIDYSVCCPGDVRGGTRKPVLVRLVHQARPQRILIDIPDHLPQIPLILHGIRLEARLEYVPRYPVLLLEIFNLRDVQFEHKFRQRIFVRRTQQKVNVVCH